MVITSEKRQQILYWFKKIKVNQIMQMTGCSKQTIYNVISDIKRNKTKPEKIPGRPRKMISKTKEMVS